MGRDRDDLIMVDLPLNERLKKRRTEVLKAGVVVEWMGKQRVRNHRRPTEFICRLDGAAAKRHRWCHGMVWHEREPRAKNFRRRTLYSEGRVSNHPGRVRCEAALDGGCRVKHHGQGLHDVPGWVDDGGEPRSV